MLKSTYSSWKEMNKRCYNKNCKAYSSYGARGITVCDRWRKSFKNFLEDMGFKSKNLSLDRIDNNSGYFKENCRWATKKVQARNRRSNHLIKINEEIKSLAEWSEKTNLNSDLIKARLKYGWTPEEALGIKEKKLKLKENIKRITAFEKTLSIKEWSKERGISITTIGRRLKKGLKGEEVFYERKKNK